MLAVLENPFYLVAATPPPAVAACDQHRQTPFKHATNRTLMAFFNTIQLDPEKLSRANARALAQNDLVLEIFRQNPNRAFSPSQLQKFISAKFDLNPPLTSWRRACSTLTKRGLLLKTAEQVPGLFGLPEFTWRYNGDVSTQTWLEQYQGGEFDRDDEEAENPQKGPEIPQRVGFVQQELFQSAAVD